MRAALLCLILAALLAVAAASPASTLKRAAQRAAPAPGCLSKCNQGMVLCLSACPQACPVDPNCMQQCYSDCTWEEQRCVSECNSVDASAQLGEEEYRAEFSKFVKQFGKQYSQDELFARYNIFKANHNKIRQHNLEHAAGKHTYTMAINEFADMTFTEFHSKMSGYKPVDRSYLRAKNADNPNAPHRKITAPLDGVDWRAQGAVTPVKNQQQCGSCWSFSATGATEGANAIATGTLVSLSEQQLVDCSTAQGNQGCNGGMMDQAFQYIISNQGITTEDAYPYQAAQGACNTDVSPAATLSSYQDVSSGDENALQQAVNIGPVSVAIEADQQCFQFYSGGVLSDPSCGTDLDHGVLVVGYGTDPSAGAYWIVKNSWGASWGEAGYIRLAMGSNECGIAQSPSYPIV